MFSLLTGQIVASLLSGGMDAAFTTAKIMVALDFHTTQAHAQATDAMAQHDGHVSAMNVGVCLLNAC